MISAMLICAADFLNYRPDLIELGTYQDFLYVSALAHENGMTKQNLLDFYKSADHELSSDMQVAMAIMLVETCHNRGDQK